MLTANRIATLSAALTGLAAFVAGVAHVLPGGAWPNYALAASGLLTKLVAVVKFLAGSQKWDALTTDRETALLNALGVGQEIPGRSEGLKPDGYTPEEPTPLPTQPSPSPPPQL